nr:amidohydrolase [Negativicutes bacterium]
MKMIVSLLLIYVTIMLGSVACAEGQGMNGVFGEIDKDGERLVGLFKKVHSDPELSFMEVNTAALVDAELQRLGYRTITKIGKTGVVGIMKNGEGPI